MRRWADGRATSRALARRAVDVMRSLSGHVPPCVCAALLRAWCNGWGTARRFQSHVLKCVLSTECIGEDCVEHYLVCPSTRRYVEKKLGLDIRSANARQILLLEPLHGCDPVFLATHLFAVKGAMEVCKRSEHYTNQTQLEDTLWERWRTAASLHPRAQLSSS